MLSESEGSCCSSVSKTFGSFDQLTSLHVNSRDDQFLASGYSRDVALYDIESGTRLQLFNNIHAEPINVAKFACHSPFLFATSSFDRCVKMWDIRQNPMRPCFTSSSSRGNVMVCFSPDDLYLLVSAVDNEVYKLRMCYIYVSVSLSLSHRCLLLRVTRLSNFQLQMGRST